MCTIKGNRRDDYQPCAAEAWEAVGFCRASLRENDSQYPSTCDWDTRPHTTAFWSRMPQAESGVASNQKEIETPQK